jgi:plasmid stability protein
MYPGREDKMPDQNAGRKIHIRMDEDLHRRLRIRCAELDTTIQEFVVELLDRELSGGRGSPRAAAPTGSVRREKKR